MIPSDWSFAQPIPPVSAPAAPLTSAAEAIAYAQKLGETAGELGALAAGTVPACFFRLREQLDDLRVHGRATLAVLGMEDGDPFFETGMEEVAGILASVAPLDRWVQAQQCAAEECECRADRLLCSLLADAGVAYVTGHSPKQGRNTCLMVGDVAAGQPLPPRYVVVEHRMHIDHMVRVHRGWRARLAVPGGFGDTVYLSPGYPNTPVSAYAEGTRACAAAVAAAL